LIILPAHLGHGSPPPTRGPGAWFHRGQQSIARGFDWMIEHVYRPVLLASLRSRYLTVSIAIALLAIGLAYATSGRMGIVLMPRVESDEARVTAVLPNGSPARRALDVAALLTETAQAVAAENGGPQLVECVYARVTGTRVELRAYLTPPEVRPLPTAEVTRLWRDRVGEIPGLESLKFESDGGGPGRGAAVTVELSHRDTRVLDAAAEDLAAALSEFETVRDVDDGTARGKEQFDLRMRPEGRSLGLTASSVARQVRAAFHGVEAIRQQRGRDELKVRVRLPESERSNEADIPDLTVRVPSGRDVPLTSVVDLERGRAYTTITHRSGRRTVTVTADVVPQEDTTRVLAGLTADVLPQLVSNHPGLTTSFQGRQAEMRDGFAVLLGGFALALFGIYFLLAIPFGSYAQPLIVMIASPFGVVGAIAGHVLMDFSMSMISLMGIVALSGVVVNDSLVLISYANGQRNAGARPWDAMVAAGTRRFRPVLLTTLTTFGGLSPMIFETSRQARFMIPMAISLGYGILFATVITVFLVPSLYVILDDVSRLSRWSRGKPAYDDEDGAVTVAAPADVVATAARG
jgi:multidrug efflux pump subunit AcrB